jgi:hypothetical protein
MFNIMVCFDAYLPISSVRSEDPITQHWSEVVPSLRTNSKVVELSGQNGLDILGVSGDNGVQAQKILLPGSWATQVFINVDEVVRDPSLSICFQDS